MKKLPTLVITSEIIQNIGNSHVQIETSGGCVDVEGGGGEK